MAVAITGNFQIQNFTKLFEYSLKFMEVGIILATVKTGTNDKFNHKILSDENCTMF